MKLQAVPVDSHVITLQLYMPPFRFPAYLIVGFQPCASHQQPVEAHSCFAGVLSCSHTSAMLGTYGGARCFAPPSGGQVCCMHHTVAYLSRRRSQWPACKSLARLCLPAGGNVEYPQ